MRYASEVTLTDALLTLLWAQAAALGGVLLWLGASWARWRWELGATVGLGPAAVVRMLWRETAAILVVASYAVRGLGRSRLMVPPEPTGRPVLCVHGFTQNGTNFWGLRRALHARGLPSRAVDLGLPFRSIERYVPRLIRGLEELLETNPNVDVVCHSMGGVVLRAALAKRPDLAGRLRTVITLGSPHRGTRYATGFEWFSADTRQLAWESPLLSRLPSLRQLAPDAHILTISAAWDLIVYPHSSSHEQGGRELHLAGLGHCGLLTHASAVQAVVLTLVSPEPGHQGGC